MIILAQKIRNLGFKKIIKFLMATVNHLQEFYTQIFTNIQLICQIHGNVRSGCPPKGRCL